MKENWVYESTIDRWDRIWSERVVTAEPAGFLQRIAPYLPRSGTAIDVAGGAGRNSVFLAQRGLDVKCADLSAVGLGLARRAAERAGVEFETSLEDCDGPPVGRWDVVFCHHFLSRKLLRNISSSLAPSGLFAFCQPTVANLERHARPSRRFLLELGELREILDPGVEIILHQEDWGDDGRHEVELLAYRVRPRE